MIITLQCLLQSTKHALSKKLSFSLNVVPMFKKKKHLPNFALLASLYPPLKPFVLINCLD